MFAQADVIRGLGWERQTRRENLRGKDGSSDGDERDVDLFAGRGGLDDDARRQQRDLGADGDVAISRGGFKRGECLMESKCQPSGFHGGTPLLPKHERRGWVRCLRCRNEP